jgi:hypothetical protein
MVDSITIERAAAAMKSAAVAQDSTLTSRGANRAPKTVDPKQIAAREPDRRPEG